MSKKRLFRQILALVTVLLLTLSTVSTAFAETTSTTVNPKTVYAQVNGVTVAFDFQQLWDAYANDNTALQTTWKGAKILGIVMPDGTTLAWDAFWDALAANEVQTVVDYANKAGHVAYTVPAQCAVVDANGVVGTVGQNPNVPVALAVSSVTAATSSSLKVAFTTAVDTTKATFEVKKDGFLVPVTVGAWNAAKTEVTLAKTYGKLLSGNYTVTVSGLDMAAGKNVGTTVVEDEKIANIAFSSDLLIKASTTTATVPYVVTNQYGEDITKTAALQGVSSYGTVAAANGVATVTKAAAGTWATTDPAQGTVTLYSGVKSVTATVTLSAAVAVKSITLGEMVLPKDTVRLSGNVTGVKINYTAVDQYGNAVTLVNGDLANCTFVYGTGLSNARIGTDPFDATKTALLVDVATVAAQSTASLTVLVNATGSASTTTFTLYPVADVANFTLTPDNATIKAGTAYKVWIDATDTYGSAVKPEDLATYSAKFSIVALNSSVFTVNTTIQYDATAKRAYLAVSPVGANSTANLVVTLLANGKNATLPITVNPASEIVAMTLSANTLNFADGGSATLKFTFIDQYNTAVKTLAGYTVKFTTSDGVVVTAPGNATVAQAVAGITVAPNASQSGKTAKLTATLEKDAVGPVAAKTIDAQDIAVKVIDASKTTLTYSIADIPTLNSLGGYDATSPYAATLELTAKDSAGNTINVPTSVIKAITSTDSTLVNAQLSGGDYVVCGLTAGLGTATTGTATLTVLVENYDGTTSIATKTVTVSQAALVPTTVKTLAADAKTEISTVEIATGDLNGMKISAANLKATPDQLMFEVKDQYGVVIPDGTFVVTNNTTGATITVSNTAGATYGVVTVTGTPAAAKSFNITLVTSNGLTKTIKVTTK